MKDEFEDKTKFENLLISTSDITEEELNKTRRPKRYSNAVKRFAITTFSYSAKAYSFIREAMIHSLPAPKTIRLWLSKVDGTPGYNKYALEHLLTVAKQAKKMGTEALGVLMLDEIHIKKNVQFKPNQQKYVGTVDMGHGEDELSDEAATKALVIMVSLVNQRHKVHLAHFFVNGLDSKALSEIVKEAVDRVNSLGLPLMSITCDNDKTNLAMLSNLGVNPRVLESKDVKDHQQVLTNLKNSLNKFIVWTPDAAHCLKLIRNNWATMKYMRYKDNDINWNFLELLNEIQQKEGYHVANKTKLKHILWHKDKMRTKLAAQILSRSNAIALIFFLTDLKDPRFKFSKETSNFLMLVDLAFDILNSKRRNNKNSSKDPLTKSNIEEKTKQMQEIIDYFSLLKDVGGRDILKSRVNAGFLGLCLGFKASLYLFQEYVVPGTLEYLLTFKLSQDHLETYFSTIRAANGNNDNPTTCQFTSSVKKLLLGAMNKTVYGNCSLPQEDLNSLYVPDTSTIEKVQDDNGNEITEVERQVDIILDQLELETDESSVVDNLLNNLQITDFKKEVFKYLSGFLYRKLLQKENCRDCFEVLTRTERISSILVKRRDFNGGSLYEPPEFIYHIVLATHRFITLKGDGLKKIKNPLNVIAINTSAYLFKKYDDFLSDFSHGLLDHRVTMAKKVSQMFASMKLKHDSIQENAIKNTKYIRRTSVKNVLLQSQ